MTYLGPILSLVFIVITARLLLKKYNPHATLLISGLLMLVVSIFLGVDLPDLSQGTGFKGFDLFKLIKDSFSKTNAGVGLMIMAIGGFVAYIESIGATDALVYIAMKPLGLFKKYPYVAASLVIPIGQALFIAIPSAAGLCLLLMASLFPLLVSLGVSRTSAASVITASTVFNIGPASAISVSATEILGVENITFFVDEQIPMVIPLSISLMFLYYFVNRYFDKREAKKDDHVEHKEIVLKVPVYYAIIPVLPIILLIVFSSLFNFTNPPIVLDTTTAMFISLFIAIAIESLRIRDVRKIMDSLKIFWNGMGNIFKSVVTLIIAADIFAKGLINLGFIEGLINLSQELGFAAIGIGVTMTIMIFVASMLMGSGNASFFAFGPLIPKISSKLGVESVYMILPMHLSASLGRAVSPVAGLIIATSDIAKISTFKIVKRNLIPLVSVLIIMLISHFIK